MNAIGRRVAVFVIAELVYALFLLTVIDGIGFLGDRLVPKSIDSGRESPAAIAVVVDLSLIALFGMQHSVMARPAFKAWWTRLAARAQRLRTLRQRLPRPDVLAVATHQPHLWNPAGLAGLLLTALFWVGWGWSSRRRF